MSIHINYFKTGFKVLKALDMGKKVTLGRKDLLDVRRKFTPFIIDGAGKKFNVIFHCNKLTSINEISEKHSLTLLVEHPTFWQRLGAVIEFHEFAIDVANKAKSITAANEGFQYLELKPTT